MKEVDVERTAYFECFCSSEGIVAEVREMLDTDEKMTYFLDRELWLSFFNKSHFGTKHSLRNRLRFAWHVLKTGYPFADMVILSQTKAKELVDFIQNNFLTLEERVPFEKENKKNNPTESR